MEATVIGDAGDHYTQGRAVDRTAMHVIVFRTVRFVAVHAGQRDIARAAVGIDIVRRLNRCIVGRHVDAVFVPGRQVGAGLVAVTVRAALGRPVDRLEVTDAGAVEMASAYLGWRLILVAVKAKRIVVGRVGSGRFVIRGNIAGSRHLVVIPVIGTFAGIVAVKVFVIVRHGHDRQGAIAGS